MFITLPNAFGDAATNMAIDAVLLETLPESSVAFRHYGWSEPALTFGYSQRHREVAAHAPAGITLCRRLTGGGIVDHRNDWTYALVIHRDATCAHSASTELYRQLHTALADALEQQGIKTRLAPCPRQCGALVAKIAGPDQCLVQPVMNDVLHPNGAKIAGAAMKRTRHGLLIQGSIARSMLADNLDQQAFHNAFVTALTAILQMTQEPAQDLRHLFDNTLIQQLKIRFASEAWLHRR